MILAFILVLIGNGDANFLELSPVLFGSEGAGFQSCHRIAPNQFFGRRGEEQAATRHQSVGDFADQALLVFSTKQEDKTPCQNSIECSIKKTRILNGFTNYRCIRKSVSERLDESWCSIDAKNIQTFGDQNLGDGETGTAAQVDDSGFAR